MSYRYEYIVFDLDGTLMDTYPGVAHAMSEAAREMGLRELNEAELRSVIGPPTEDSLERLFGLTGEDNDRGMAAWSKYYASPEGAGNSPWYPGVVETLEKLRARGCKVAIATMKPWPYTSICLQTKQAEALFDAVLCYEDNSGITKAQLILQSIEQMGGTPAQALMIGDTLTDSRGAAQAGVDFAAVTGGFGFQTQAELDEAVSVAVARLLPELWPVLDQRLPD